MKAILGQVLVIAALSMVLVGVYFYKTARAAEQPNWQPTPAAAQANVPKSDNIEIVSQPPKDIKPIPEPNGGPMMAPPVAQPVEPQHGFFWRLWHPRHWRIFHHRQHKCRCVQPAPQPCPCVQPAPQPCCMPVTVYQPVKVRQPVVTYKTVKVYQPVTTYRPAWTCGCY